MNILHLLISGGLGGIENLCRNIALSGMEQHYLCFLWEGGPNAELLQQAGKEIFLLGEKKTALWSTQKKLRQICRDRQIDIVNLQHGGPFVDLQLLWLKKALPQIKIVSTEHCMAEYYQNQQKNPIGRLVWGISFREKFRRVDKILAVSEAVKESYVKQFHLPPEKISVVYNGISDKLLDNGKKYIEKTENSVKSKEYCKKTDIKLGIKGKMDNYNLLFVGRMDGYKGCEYLIQAVEGLENTTLTLVGDGSQRASLEALVKEKKLTNRILFVGYQTNIEKYLEKADIFVYPPVMPEAFGLAPVEAMAFGVPCVVTKMGGLQEIVRDGRNGYLCEGADADSLRCAIRQLMVQFKEGQQESFRREARRTAEKFSIGNTIEQLEGIYRELLEKTHEQ